ncbi:MAG: DNA topoisomerase IB [Cyanobacteria bacterium SZAS-4]|nr:DNA topoisomerase IB [Cyanobacteria bacterium SZAS-4]
MIDWEARANSAGLLYVQNFENGCTRKKCGKGFKFIGPDGKTLLDKGTRQRILALVIPPAWKDVWICSDPDGHIQATGFDEAGRKQYIYHPRWHEASSAHKYGRLKVIAGLMPTIRRHVKADLKSNELSKRRVVAAVVRLLDKACIRIGNRQYLQANDSRGATTLTSEHVCRNSHEISLSFKGKSGKQIELKCADEGLAAVIEDCEKSDGEFLFSYENEHNEFVAVTSSDVNSYLLEIAKESVTAKDFRTWRGSVVALNELATMPEDLSKTAKKKAIVSAVKSAAAALGNTPAVCRSSYIHSAILASADAGILPPLVRRLETTNLRRAGLTKEEMKLVAFLTHIETEDTKPAAIRPQKPSDDLAA